MASFVFWCPDRHLSYSGSTPETVGLGGGVTARIHLARVLALAGADVTVVCNCPAPDTVDGALPSCVTWRRIRTSSHARRHVVPDADMPHAL